MRRYAMTMTMSAVSVAVLLLGLPLGGAWIVSALRTAGNGNRVAIIGTVINVLRLTAQDAGLGRMSAIGLAAFLAGLLAALGAKWTKYSRVTLSVPAVVVMIPGVPLYRALSALNDGLQVNAAIPEIVTLCLAITAIGVGLALSRMVTDRNWLMS